MTVTPIETPEVSGVAGSERSRVRAWGTGAAVLALVFALGQGLMAQLDPLIGLKRLPPNVVVVLDTSFRMLDDGAGNYHDVKTYNRADDVSVASALGVSAATYRRIYQNLQFETTITPSNKYTTTDIVAVQASDPAYSTFWAPTRFETARAGLHQAVRENPALVRWGLLKLRQNGEVWRDTTSSSGCDQAVRTTGSASLASVGDQSPCVVDPLSLGNRFGIYAPAVAGANFNVTAGASDAVVYGVGTANAAANIMVAAQQAVGTGVLIPAGADTAQYADRPLTNALTDARAHVSSVMAADSLRACRNSIVVLLAGGGDDGDTSYRTSHDPISTAASFAAVSSGGATRRVPIMVVGIKPDPSAVAELAGIAAASGGQYFSAASAADVALAINYAVQAGFSKCADLDAARPSEFTSVSPVVGTVNLVNAKDVTGAALPDSDILVSQGQATGQPVPQRSNFMVTAGYALPSFEGRIRAFRAYKPQVNSSQPTGWGFNADGSRLWPDLDGRASLAGMARTPLSSNTRNIYTFIPNGSGGGQVVAFDLSQSATLGPHLGGADPNVLIPFVRSQPLGAVIGSMPAIMDPPSLDPPPDAEYGFPNSVGTFAGTYKNRRSMIFFGANDGMVHAVDARTGYEVWAFIPYNLLPKLRTLMDGQPVEQFDYFVDSSPKVAEVKIAGAWKTLLIIGQSYGGTFYTAFDVTQAGMGVAQDADGLPAVNAMLAQFDAPNESIRFEWAFPNFSSFDPSITFTAALSDGFPGGRVTLYGDLNTNANSVEKRVGFTFSDPAVGPLTDDRSLTAVITGSGYFPDVEGLLPNRGGTAAGRSLFVLDAQTGLPVNNLGAGCSGVGCLDLGDVSNGRKNALQADVTAASDQTSPAVVTAYAGDTDGKYYRFNLSQTGGIVPTVLIDSGQPIYSSSALLFVGTTSRYLFFGTGSDLLPAANPGGGSTGQGTAFRLYGIQDSLTVGVAGNVTLQRDLAPKVVSTGLLTNGERPTSSPTVAGDIVFFTTTTDAAAGTCSDATTKVYGFTYLGTAAYDTNGNGKIDNNESPLITTASGRGTAPFIVDQHLFLSTTSLLGTGVTVLGDPADFNNGVGQVGVRILSWREIR
jgi:hypothetical protein